MRFPHTHTHRDTNYKQLAVSIAYSRDGRAHEMCHCCCILLSLFRHGPHLCVSPSQLSSTNKFIFFLSLSHSLLFSLHYSIWFIEFRKHFAPVCTRDRICTRSIIFHHIFSHQLRLAMRPATIKREIEEYSVMHKARQRHTTTRLHRENGDGNFINESVQVHMHTHTPTHRGTHQDTLNVGCAR